ncbi:Heat shock protein 40 like protein [Ectocarpus siliculosus]|uniref:Hsp70-Hsp90 organising protein n=1 Tax=Ectocarpus siliculosus TaxID=2880 RepID=D7FVD0_ECTSI|nr:Heat shock protein 40 like protein [Ectocarpus siliculosus]|eukprot:CBJ26302.1 Heat shock protein 40 like protein [Ectocarpus siliculosus]
MADAGAAEEKHGQDAQEEEDWKIQAEAFKNEGNEAFKTGKWKEAIEGYTRAIDIDPDNKVYFSNRSAAYLKLGDAKSKALKDAERCMELAPEWSKSFSRLGAAQHALGRFDGAVQTFKAGLAIDPNNAGLESSLAAAKEAQETDRRERWRQAAIERDIEEERLKKKDALKAKAKAEAAEAAEAKAAAAVEAGEGTASGDPLSSFFSEIQGEQKSVPAKKVERVLHDKYTNQDMGTPKEQMDRLLQHNYKWKNLNAFETLQLGQDATVEDIKQRYRKLSTLVHPDKRLDMPQARDAFEEVKKAYQLLLDEDRRITMAATIDAVCTRVSKERQKKIDKGVALADLTKELGSEEAHKKKACMKEFATIELRRREIEKHRQAQKKREHSQEEAEKDAIRKNVEGEKAWAETERREKRVGGWRDFQKGGNKPKVQKTWKQEMASSSEKPKFGVVDAGDYKKDWK